MTQGVTADSTSGNCPFYHVVPLTAHVKNYHVINITWQCHVISLKVYTSKYLCDTQIKSWRGCFEVTFTVTLMWYQSQPIKALYGIDMQKLSPIYSPEQEFTWYLYTYFNSALCNAFKDFTCIFMTRITVVVFSSKVLCEYYMKAEKLVPRYFLEPFKIYFEVSMWIFSVNITKISHEQEQHITWQTCFKDTLWNLLYVPAPPFLMLAQPAVLAPPLLAARFGRQTLITPTAALTVWSLQGVLTVWVAACPTALLWSWSVAMMVLDFLALEQLLTGFLPPIAKPRL